LIAAHRLYQQQAIGQTVSVEESSPLVTKHKAQGQGFLPCRRSVASNDGVRRKPFYCLHVVYSSDEIHSLFDQLL
jgi:hypothetical protein